jgi:hypothetical protein
VRNNTCDASILIYPLKLTATSYSTLTSISALNLSLNQNNTTRSQSNKQQSSKMAVYPTKTAFFAQGVEPCSMNYDKPNCLICKERLRPTPSFCTRLRLSSPTTSRPMLSQLPISSLLPPSRTKLSLRLITTPLTPTATRTPKRTPKPSKITRPSRCPAAVTSSDATASSPGSRLGLRAPTVGRNYSLSLRWQMSTDGEGLRLCPAISNS